MKLGTDMARAQNKLSDTECRAALRPGMLGDGGGLYLNVKPSGSKSWVFVRKRDGRRRGGDVGARAGVPHPHTGRSGEVLEAEWSEFDFGASLWTVPAARMKAGKEHRVPLSEPALAIVRALHEVRVSDHVFPGHAKGKPLLNVAFAKLLERMKADQYTPHGFRSSFRDWTGDARLEHGRRVR